MSLQLLNEINKNYHMAVSVHRELADVFWFLYMKGYALWNEYQYLDENMTQRKLKRYMISTYHVSAPEEMPKSANIAEPLLKGKNRKSLKMEDTWNIIQEAFRVYVKWEESAIEKYQKIAAEILANGDTSTFTFVSDEIVKPVKAELVYVTDKVIELSSHDWDMPQIVAEQPDYFERYEYLIKHLLGKSEKFHHWNGALDAESSVFFKKASD